MWSITNLAYEKEGATSIGEEGFVHLFLRTIKMLLPLIRPVYKHLCISFLLQFIIMGFELIHPYVILRLVDHVYVQQDMNELFWCFILLTIVPIILEVLRYLRRRLDKKVENAIVSSLRIRLYDHVQRLHIRFFVESPPAKIVSRITSDVPAVQMLCNSIIRRVIELCRFAITVRTLIALEWRLAMLSLLTFPIAYILLTKVAMRAREKANQTINAYDIINSRLTEQLSADAMLLTKIFGREKSNVEKLTEDIKAEMDSDGKEQRLMTFLHFCVSYSGQFNTALVYYFGGILIFKGSLTIGGLIFFTQTVSEVHRGLCELLTARLGYIKRVFELLQLPIEIKDPVEPVTFTTDKGSVVTGDISLENVSLDYSLLPPLKITAADKFDTSKANNAPKHRDWALNNLSLHFKAGTMNAIVGRSGTGKSTLMKLVHRILDPTQGLVKLDGVDIRQLRLEELVSYMGVVSQDSFFFNDSVRNNLLFAKTSATDDEMEQACRAANVWSLIESFPNKLDEKVGENGYKLSGGERQRLSIARTILKSPKIILLDEATSSLDSENENLIKKAMNELFKNRTSLVIAHRLSTIVDADQIIVMDNGSVVECGTHNDLLNMNGHYKGLYDAQYSKQK